MTPSLGNGAGVPRGTEKASRLGRARKRHGETATLVGMRFVVWAQGLRHFPTPGQVQARFGCSYATANRWLNFWEEASCQQRPRNPSSEVRLGLRLPGRARDRRP